MQRPVVQLEPTDPGSRVLGVELALDQQGGAFHVGLWTRHVIVLWPRQIQTGAAIAHELKPVEEAVLGEVGR